MIRTFKYRAYANSRTIANAENWLKLCHNLYNVALQQRIMIYKQDKGRISCYKQMNQLPEIKKAFPEYSSVGSQVLQQVLERLDRSYQNFFRRIKNGEKVGFPRFKGRDRYNSFTLKQCGWKLSGKYLSIYNMGILKLKISQPIQGDIKAITISRQSNKWYVLFICDNILELKLPQSQKSVGIDVGIKSFCIDSDNNIIDNPKYFRQLEKSLRRKQRKLSRCKRSSNHRHKAKLLVTKTHEHIKNQRNDFLHKTANHYVKNYGFIAVENLNIKGMVKNHHLAKPISDSSWGKFFDLLSYKAEEAGRIVVKVPRFEPTSKTCSNCGAVKQDLTLNDRQWVCHSCGTLHDRDINAAKNILRVGQTLQASTCGDSQGVACEPLKSGCQDISSLSKGC